MWGQGGEGERLPGKKKVGERLRGTAREREEGQASATSSAGRVLTNRHLWVATGCVGDTSRLGGRTQEEGGKGGAGAVTQATPRLCIELR